MPYQTVHVKINKKTGNIDIEGEGFIGDQCDILSQVENQLGRITNIEDKPEKYQHVQPDFVPNTLG